MTRYKFESNLKVIHQVGRAWETLAVACLHLQCNVTAPKNRGLRFGGGLPAVPASLRRHCWSDGQVVLILVFSS